MKTIWKYPIRVGDSVITMPTGAKFLDVQMQNAEPQAWFLVDTEQGLETRNFTIYGTGHQIDDRRQVYLGTFQLRGGILVFHLFEVLP